MHSDIQEHKSDEGEPILYADEKALLKIFLLGIPNWREIAFSYVTIGVNLLLALMTFDLVFRGPVFHPAQDLRFSRVGYVDCTTAKVLFREPDPAQLPVYVYYKESDKTSWTTMERIYHLDADTDYTYPVTFSGLAPGTSYTYSMSNDLSGTFTTAPSPYSPAANRLTFLTSSCIKANFPYRLFTHALSIHGLDYLSKIVKSIPSPISFMLFVGDFIYVDVPLRLSSSMSHYRSEYRRVYASPSWKNPGLSGLPWLHTLDDHEIANDWSGGNDTAPFPAASDPFIHYHVSVNPPIPQSAPSGPDTNTTYFQFTNGPASFFMLDTRRYREEPEPNSNSSGVLRNHTMLGAPQLKSLLTYLASPEPGHIYWKIIASSIPFTKNWRLTADTWAGYLHERSIILEAMHAAERDLGIRVIILSGGKQTLSSFHLIAIVLTIPDRHEFAAIRFPPPILNLPGSDPSSTDEVVYDRTPQSGPHEFSVGPLSMFYLPIRTFKQTDGQDVAIQYMPDGNSKVGAIDIRNLEGTGDQKSLLKYSLWIDGKVAWEYTLTSPAPGFKASGRFRGKGIPFVGWTESLWN